MYYILLKQSGVDLDTTYKYLTDIEAGTGARIKKKFDTLAEAKDCVQDLIVNQGYALNSIVVVKGVTVTVSLDLEEESVEGGNG